MKWRIVLVNATIPAAAFYTIQKQDLSVYDYTNKASSFIGHLVSKYNIPLTIGSIGDAYSDWRTEEIDFNFVDNIRSSTQPLN